MVNYINTKDIENNNSLTSRERRTDKITGITWFTHGLNDQTIPFGYDIKGLTKKEKEDLIVNLDTVKDMNKSAFNNAFSKFYSCNTAVGGRNSFAQAWSNLTGGVKNKYGKEG